MNECIKTRLQFAVKANNEQLTSGTSDEKSEDGVGLGLKVHSRQFVCFSTELQGLTD